MNASFYKMLWKELPQSTCKVNETPVNFYLRQAKISVSIQFLRVGHIVKTLIFKFM